MRHDMLGRKLVLLGLATCGALGAFAVRAAGAPASPKRPGRPPSAEEARGFVERAEARLLELGNRLGRAQWVMSTYITDDTEQIAAEANKDYIAATMQLAAESKRFDGLALPADVARRILLLKLSLPMPAPADPKLQTRADRDRRRARGRLRPRQVLPAGQAAAWTSARSRR